MKEKSHKLSEREIDSIVVSQAGDNSKWTKPISVQPQKSVPVFLTLRVAEKLKREAQKRHVKNYRKWVNKFVEQHLAE